MKRYDVGSLWYSLRGRARQFPVLVRRIVHGLLTSINSQVRRPLVWLAAIGVLLRLILAVSTNSIDQIDVLSGFFAYHFKGQPYFSYVYSLPPVQLVVTWPSLSLLSLFKGPYTWFTYSPWASIISNTQGMVSPLVPSPELELALKAPLIIADALTASLVYRILRSARFSRTTAEAFFVFYWLNPLVIFESSIHGATDSLIPLVVLAFAFGIQTNRPIMSGFSASMGFLTLFFPAYLAIMGLSYLLCQALFRGKRTLRSAIRPLSEFIAGLAIPLALFALLLPNVLFLNQSLLNSYAQTPCVCGDTFWQLVNPSDGWLGAQLGGLFFPWNRGIALSLRVFDTLFAITPGVLLFMVNSRRPGPAAWSSAVYGSTALVTILVMQTLTGLAPENFVWVMGCLLVLVAFRPSFKLHYQLLTAVGVVGELVIQGPFAFGYTLATYGTQVSPQLLTNLSLDYWSGSWGIASPAFLWNAEGLMGGIVLIFLTISLVLLIHDLNSEAGYPLHPLDSTSE
jgi:hypothetical protein